MKPVDLIPSALSELFVDVSMSRKVTLADRYGLMAALLDESLEQEDLQAIDRILYGIHRKRVAVVNELSNVKSRQTRAQDSPMN